MDIKEKTSMGKNWYFQWRKFSKDDAIRDNADYLFKEWIYPNTLEDFRGKDVLDCGCGRGQHLKQLLPFIKTGTGIDLECASVASAYINNERVTCLDGDLSKLQLDRTFDIVYSIGVIHHTDDPETTFNAIKRHVRPGGKLIIWVYSREGNFLNRAVLEPLKRVFFDYMPRPLLLCMSFIITVLLYVPVYSVYLLPLHRLPFYSYFGNFRFLSFWKNYQNVFDKLNAPQTHFIRKATLERWFNSNEFTRVHISPYVGVSWRASGERR
jgi:SAM-dependent methyltransferase